MARRAIVPHLDVLKQWRKEAGEEMEKEYADKPAGHPALIMAIASAYIKGYMRGRMQQWRLEQELAVFRESLDKPPL